MKCMWEQRNNACKKYFSMHERVFSRRLNTPFRQDSLDFDWKYLNFYFSLSRFLKSTPSREFIFQLFTTLKSVMAEKYGIEILRL